MFNQTTITSSKSYSLASDFDTLLELMIHSDTTPDEPHYDGASESLYNTKQHCITSRELSTCQYLKGRLLIICENSLNLDQAQQNVGPDLNWKLYNTLMVCLKEIFKKVDFQKNSRQQKYA